MRTAVIFGVLLLITLVNSQGRPNRGGNREGKPRAPPKPEKDEKPPKPSNAREGHKGRLEFNLTSINREVLVWPKGCVFGLRKLNCTRSGERCKPMIFALDTVKELDTCGGQEVGKAPGGNKRKRGADRDALKKVQCVIESSDSCMIPDSSVPAVCVNASAYISDESYFSFNLYIATENGNFTFLDQEYSISKGQTKFTLGYVGKTCCSGDDSCSCDDGVTGALDVGLRIVGPPGKARKDRARGQGRSKVNEISAGDAMMEFPGIVDVDDKMVQIEDGDFRVEDVGSDSKISMCIRNVSNYFLYDPTVTASSTEDQGDSTTAIDSDFGENVKDNGANYPVVTAAGCIMAALITLMLQ